MSSAFDSFRANLPPPAESLAILLGLAEVTIFGLAGLANPLEFSKAYGLPLLTSSSTPLQEDETEDKVTTTQKALVKAIAVRNLQNGVLLLALGIYVKDRRALGVAVTAGLVATVSDVLIVRAHGVGENVWGHVIGVFNCAAVGASLLRWKRDDPWW